MTKRNKAKRRSIKNKRRASQAQEKRESKQPNELPDNLLRSVEANGLRPKAAWLDAVRSHSSFQPGWARRVAQVQGNRYLQALVESANREGSGPGVAGIDRGRAHPQQVQRSIGDGHDLSSPRFAGDPVLEACYDDERYLRFGHSGPAVRKVQEALIVAGHPLERFGPDGDFGLETQTAVKEFQGSLNLSDDGIIGTNTMEELDRRFLPADQREGLARPDAGRQQAIDEQLHPTSTSSGGVRTPWDGAERDGAGNLTPAAIQARTDFKNELTQALNDHLADVMPRMQDLSSARRLPITEFEGAGTAAKQVTDEKFGEWTSVAAMTPSQSSARHGFQFRGSGPGQTLFDANDPAQRAQAGFPVDAQDLASWIAETDSDAQSVWGNHHFDKNRSQEERDFLRTEVIDPFVAANRADLELYDLFGFALSGDRIVLGTTVGSSLSDVPGSSGEPSPAERSEKWEAWKILVHEYIHTLEHPTFNRAAGGNRIMKEGFCELFTKEVLTEEIPNAASDVDLRRQVEGGVYSPPPANVIGGYGPGAYAGYLSRVEEIRDSIIGGDEGERAVRAAFFQGHVEFLGLNPDGSQAAPASEVSENLITVPPGVSNIPDLSARTGVPVPQILAANFGLTLADPLPAQVNLPGFREHVVVESEDQRGVTRTETREQIAIQNGVTEAQLAAANPSVNWRGLSAGQRVLVPIP